MFDDIKVSVVVPVYKCEKYIRRCIESILVQTHSDLEVILVADGNADNSSHICGEYALRDKRIVFIEQENQGAAVARNRGIETSTGEWIMFVDGDDWIEKDCVEVLLKKALETKSDIVISGFFVDTDVDCKESTFFTFSNMCFDEANNAILLENCLVNGRYSLKKPYTNVGVPWARIYNTRFVLDNKLSFPNGLRRMQDTVFNLYALNAARQVYVIENHLYHYNSFNSSSVTKAYNSNYFDTGKRLLSEVKTFIEKSGNEDLYEIMYEKTISIVIEGIRLQFLPRDCPLGFLEKISILKDVMYDKNSLIYEGILKSGTNYMNCKQRFLRALMRRGFVFSLYLTICFRTKIGDIFRYAYKFGDIK